MNLETSVRTGYYWADEPGGTKRRGARIERGRHFVWLPDEEILALATTLADYLEKGRRTAGTTNTTNQH